MVKEFNETFASVSPEERETTDREFSISGNVPFYHSNSNHKEHGKYIFRISTYDFVYGKKSDKKIQLKDLKVSLKFERIEKIILIVFFSKVLIKCCSTYRFFGFGEQHEGTQWRMDSIGFNYNLASFLELLRSEDFKKLMKEIREHLNEEKSFTDESSEPPTSAAAATTTNSEKKTLKLRKRSSKPVLKKPPQKSSLLPSKQKRIEQYFKTFQTSEDDQNQDEDDALDEEEEMETAT